MNANGFVDLLQASGGSSLVKSSDNGGWSKMVACRWTQTSHDIEVPHSEDHFVELMLGGKQRRVIKADGRRVGEIDARPRDITFLPAGHRVECIAEGENADVLHLMFSPSTLVADTEEAFARSQPLSIEPFAARRDTKVLQLALMLEEELRSPEPMGSLYADGLSQAFAVAFARGFTEQKPLQGPLRGLSPRQLRIATEYLETNLASDVRLADVAAAIGINPFHFGRQFKRSTGQTPHQYLTRRRVQRAMEMLSETQLSIAEIAVACGFYDQAHLTTTLRKVTGTPPGEYRKLMRATAA